MASRAVTFSIDIRWVSCAIADSISLFQARQADASTVGKEPVNSAAALSLIVQGGLGRALAFSGYDPHVVGALTFITNFYLLRNVAKALISEGREVLIWRALALLIDDDLAGFTGNILVCAGLEDSRYIVEYFVVGALVGVTLIG